MTVADVGAGSGYFTVRLAARVGAKGRVYANDLQPEMLKMLAARLARENVRNVTLVQGAIDDPKLAASSLDLVLMVDVYHEFSEPQKMLRALRTALKPGGRLVLLEYRKEDPDVPIRFEHKMSVAEAKMELEAEGFTLAQSRWPPAAAAHSDIREIAHVRAETEQSRQAPSLKMPLKTVIYARHANCHSNRRP